MKTQKVIASLTLFFFLFQTFAFSAPELIQTSISSKEINPVRIDIDIPGELGQIQRAYQSSVGTGVIIHIQDAHGNYEAQQNILAVMRHLRGKYGIKLLLMEGADDKLDPGLMNFFKDNRLNEKVADILMKYGEFTGPEMHLLSAGGAAVGYGIETTALYRKDVELFRQVIRGAETTKAYLEGVRGRIQVLESRIFSKDLRDFVKEWRKQQSERANLLNHINVLAKQAGTLLSLDLKDPVNQDAYPAILRVLKLKDIEGTLDAKKIEAEKQELLAAVKGKIDSGLYEKLAAMNADKKLGKLENPRFVLEKIHEQAKGLDYRLYPNFSKYAAYLVFQAEIESEQLFKEAENLTGKIFDALAKSEEEKNLLGSIKDEVLLEKLYTLELSRSECLSIASRKEVFSPVKFSERIAGMEKQEKKAAADLLETEELFASALEFYQVAQDRENHFIENAVSAMKKTGETQAVVVTGGFHAEGFEAMVKAKGLSYLLISPRISEIGNSHEVYLDAMLGKNNVNSVQLAEDVKTVVNTEAAKSQVMVATHLETDEQQTALWGAEETSVRRDFRSNVVTLVRQSGAELQMAASLGGPAAAQPKVEAPAVSAASLGAETYVPRKREVLLFDPGYDLAVRNALDTTGVYVAPTPRSAEEVYALLEYAEREGLVLEIEAHLRGVDGAGSSLDLPEFQLKLTKRGVKNIPDIPSTPTLASMFSVKIRFEKAADPNVIEYVAPDYGITEAEPYRVRVTDETGKVKGIQLVEKMREGKKTLQTPKGQKDGPAYVFANIFGLKGVRIVLDEMPPMALAGGMESSNAFNVALYMAASMLSGQNWSMADIFERSVADENTVFGGLTGGQGHLSSILGGAYRHTWLSGIKSTWKSLLKSILQFLLGWFMDVDKLINENVNRYAAFSEQLLAPEQVEHLGGHMALVQAGKTYERKADGSWGPKDSRSAGAINDIWTALLRMKDPVGVALHSSKLALAAIYTEELKKAAMATTEEEKKAALEKVAAAVNKYVDTRVALLERWDALAAQGKVEPRDANTDYLGPARALIMKAREYGIAIMPLGAGGPGANNVAISPDKETLERFLREQGLEEVTDAKAQEMRSVIRGTAADGTPLTGEHTLKGYMPFKMSSEPAKATSDWEKLGVKLPAQPMKVLYDEATGRFENILAQAASLGAEAKIGLSEPQEVRILDRAEYDRLMQYIAGRADKIRAVLFDLDGTSTVSDNKQGTVKEKYRVRHEANIARLAQLAAEKVIVAVTTSRRQAAAVAFTGEVIAHPNYLAHIEPNAHSSYVEAYYGPGTGANDTGLGLDIDDYTLVIPQGERELILKALMQAGVLAAPDSPLVEDLGPKINLHVPDVMDSHAFFESVVNILEKAGLLQMAWSPWSYKEYSPRVESPFIPLHYLGGDKETTIAPAVGTKGRDREYFLNRHGLAPDEVFLIFNEPQFGRNDYPLARTGGITVGEDPENLPEGVLSTKKAIGLTGLEAFAWILDTANKHHAFRRAASPQAELQEAQSLGAATKLPVRVLRFERLAGVPAPGESAGDDRVMLSGMEPQPFEILQPQAVQYAEGEGVRITRGSITPSADLTLADVNALPADRRMLGSAENSSEIGLVTIVSGLPPYTPGTSLAGGDSVRVGIHRQVKGFDGGGIQLARPVTAAEIAANGGRFVEGVSLESGNPGNVELELADGAGDILKLASTRAPKQGEILVFSVTDASLQAAHVDDISRIMILSSDIPGDTGAKTAVFRLHVRPEGLEVLDPSPVLNSTDVTDFRPSGQLVSLGNAEDSQLTYSSQTGIVTVTGNTGPQGALPDFFGGGAMALRPVVTSADEGNLVVDIASTAGSVINVEALGWVPTGQPDEYEQHRAYFQVQQVGADFHTYQLPGANLARYGLTAEQVSNVIVIGTAQNGVTQGEIRERLRPIADLSGPLTIEFTSRRDGITVKDAAGRTAYTKIYPAKVDQARIVDGILVVDLNNGKIEVTRLDNPDNTVSLNGASLERVQVTASEIKVSALKDQRTSVNYSLDKNTLATVSAQEEAFSETAAVSEDLTQISSLPYVKDQYGNLQEFQAGSYETNVSGAENAVLVSSKRQDEGGGLSFDNFQTPAVETADLSGRASITIGVLANRPEFRYELVSVDENGYETKWSEIITGLLPGKFQTVTIDLAKFAAHGVDLSRVRLAPVINISQGQAHYVIFANPSAVIQHSVTSPDGKRVAVAAYDRVYILPTDPQTGKIQTMSMKQLFAGMHASQAVPTAIRYLETGAGNIDQVIEVTARNGEKRYIVHALHSNFDYIYNRQALASPNEQRLLSSVGSGSSRDQYLTVHNVQTGVIKDVSVSALETPSPLTELDSPGAIKRTVASNTHSVTSALAVNPSTGAVRNRLIVVSYDGTPAKKGEIDIPIPSAEDVLAYQYDSGRVMSDTKFAVTLKNGKVFEIDTAAMTAVETGTRKTSPDGRYSVIFQNGSFTVDRTDTADPRYTQTLAVEQNGVVLKNMQVTNDALIYVLDDRRVFPRGVTRIFTLFLGNVGTVTPNNPSEVSLPEGIVPAQTGSIRFDRADQSAVVFDADGLRYRVNLFFRSNLEVAGTEKTTPNGKYRVVQDTENPAVFYVINQETRDAGSGKADVTRFQVKTAFARVDGDFQVTDDGFQIKVNNQNKNIPFTQAEDSTYSRRDFSQIVVDDYTVLPDVPVELSTLRSDTNLDRLLDGTGIDPASVNLPKVGDTLPGGAVLNSARYFLARSFDGKSYAVGFSGQYNTYTNGRPTSISPSGSILFVRPGQEPLTVDTHSSYAGFAFGADGALYVAKHYGTPGMVDSYDAFGSRLRVVSGVSFRLPVADANYLFGTGSYGFEGIKAENDDFVIAASNANAVYVAAKRPELGTVRLQDYYRDSFSQDTQNNQDNYELAVVEARQVHPENSRLFELTLRNGEKRYMSITTTQTASGPRVDVSIRKGILSQDGSKLVTLSAPDFDGTANKVYVTDTAANQVTEIAATERFVKMENVSSAEVLLTAKNGQEFILDLEENRIFSQTSVFDVNGDGIPAPLGALRIINLLNAHGSIDKTHPAYRYVFDLNRDGRISPIDVLMLINELNRRSSAEAEGEPVAVSVIKDPTDGSQVVAIDFSSGQREIFDYQTLRFKRLENLRPAAKIDLTRPFGEAELDLIATDVAGISTPRRWKGVDELSPDDLTALLEEPVGAASLGTGQGDRLTQIDKEIAGIVDQLRSLRQDEAVYGSRAHAAQPELSLMGTQPYSQREQFQVRLEDVQRQIRQLSLQKQTLEAERRKLTKPVKEEKPEAPTAESLGRPRIMASVTVATLAAATGLAGWFVRDYYADGETIRLTAQLSAMSSQLAASQQDFERLRAQAEKQVVEQRRLAAEKYHREEQARLKAIAKDEEAARKKFEQASQAIKNAVAGYKGEFRIHINPVGGITAIDLPSSLANYNKEDFHLMISQRMQEGGEFHPGTVDAQIPYATNKSILVPSLEEAAGTDPLLQVTLIYEPSEGRTNYYRDPGNAENILVFTVRIPNKELGSLVVNEQVALKHGLVITGDARIRIEAESLGVQGIILSRADFLAELKAKGEFQGAVSGGSRGHLNIIAQLAGNQVVALEEYLAHYGGVAERAALNAVVRAWDGAEYFKAPLATKELPRTTFGIHVNRIFMEGPAIVQSMAEALRSDQTPDEVVDQVYDAVTAASLGQGAGEALAYSEAVGRAVPVSILEVAHDVTLDVYNLEGATAVVVNYYRGELGLSDEPEAVSVESEAVRAVNEGLVKSQDVLTHLGIEPPAARKPVILFVNEIFGDEDKKLSPEQVSAMAGKIAQGLNQGDLFVGVVEQNQNRLMAKLYEEAAKGQFRAKAVPQALLSDSAVESMTAKMDAAPIALSSLADAGDAGLKAGNMTRIRFNKKAMKDAGMSLDWAVGLLEQIADNPEALRKLGLRPDSEGFWEAGSGFVALIERVYAEMKAQGKLAVAA